MWVIASQRRVRRRVFGDAASLAAADAIAEAVRRTPPTTASAEAKRPRWRYGPLAAFEVRLAATVLSFGLIPIIADDTSTPMRVGGLVAGLLLAYAVAPRLLSVDDAGVRWGKLGRRRTTGWQDVRSVSMSINRFGDRTVAIGLADDTSINLALITRGAVARLQSALEQHAPPTVEKAAFIRLRSTNRNRLGHWLGLS